MSVLTQYKVSRVFPKLTIILEFWDGIFVKTWRVKKAYNGGNVLNFINENEHSCNPNYQGLDEFYESHI